MSKKGKQPKPKKGPWPEMPQKAFDDLNLYVAQLAAEVMGLGEWRITLKPEPAMEDCHAHIEITENTQEAHLYVARDFNTLDKQRRKEVLMHELTHCHMERLWEHVDEAKVALGMMGEVWAGTIRGMFELTTDNIAFSWATMLDDSAMNHLLYEEPKP
jgi:hypothetical protein